MALCEAEPPGSVQLNLYVAVNVRAPVDSEPLIATLPDRPTSCPTPYSSWHWSRTTAPIQPPDAAQEATLVDDQLSVAAAPLLTVLGPFYYTQV